MSHGPPGKDGEVKWGRKPGRSGAGEDLYSLYCCPSCVRVRVAVWVDAGGRGIWKYGACRVAAVQIDSSADNVEKENGWISIFLLSNQPNWQRSSENFGHWLGYRLARSPCGGEAPGPRPPTTRRVRDDGPVPRHPDPDPAMPIMNSKLPAKEVPFYAPDHATFALAIAAHAKVASRRFTAQNCPISVNHGSKQSTGTDENEACSEEYSGRNFIVPHGTTTDICYQAGS